KHEGVCKLYDGYSAVETKGAGKYVETVDGVKKITRQAGQRCMVIHDDSDYVKLYNKEFPENGGNNSKNNSPNLQRGGTKGQAQNFNPFSGISSQLSQLYDEMKNKKKVN